MAETLAEIHARMRREYDLVVQCSDADAVAWVEALPSELKARLSLGPLHGHDTCRVCGVLAHVLGFNDPTNAAELKNPAWLILLWHDTLYVMDDDDIEHVHANETYRRCITLYNAAGWDGFYLPPRELV